MSGVRWTTGVGIALGGVGGAVAALLGAPARPAALPAPKPPVSSVLATQPTPVAATVGSPPELGASAAPSLGAASSPTPSPSSTAPPPSAAAVTAAASTSLTPAPLALPTSAEALVTAEVLCDRKKQYDECSRAAEALEKGSAGPVDAVQAKRFRRIALTHLVRECETGDPHACFILAAKYRAGSELEASTVRAAALEKRALDLCRLRTAPECPAR